MIQLINITEPDALDELHTYEIRIKSLSSTTIVTTFKHRPIEGLSRCLQKAALAVEKALSRDNTPI